MVGVDLVGLILRDWLRGDLQGDREGISCLDVSRTLKMTV
ncbi:hypothetical protein CGH54_00810 [Vibrio parahaemolyticus]|nr:hypothetical protein [Vibrio parahaemolyticus]TOK68060.1 hypothetical protein CGI14_12550 [Vibrio parahaemolyticus]TON63564.1 hypothetical protein CGH54_00810 [Vibrio parahaemolyticus]